MPKLCIVPMQHQHLNALAELEQICFSHPWSYRALAEELSNRSACFLTALFDNKVAGYLGAHIAVGECYIDNIAVFPQFRGQGIAQQLILALIGQIKKQNGEFVSLEVRESNFPAIHVYEKAGFQKMGIRKNFYRDPPENAVIMTYFLKE